MTSDSQVMPMHLLVKGCHEQVSAMELLPVICMIWQLIGTSSISNAAIRVPANSCELPTTFRLFSTTACLCLVQELHPAGAQLEEASHSAPGAHLPLRSPLGRAL